MKIEIDAQKILNFLKPHWILSLMVVMASTTAFTIFFLRYAALLAGVSFSDDGRMATFVMSLIAAAGAGLTYLGLKFRWFEP